MKNQVGAKARHCQGIGLRSANVCGLADHASLFLEHPLPPTHTFFVSSSLMITGHGGSANSHFHREEGGSSWSGGVALAVDQPSVGKAHLEEKQHEGGWECRKVARAHVLRKEVVEWKGRREVDLGENSSSTAYWLFTIYQIVASLLWTSESLSVKQALKDLSRRCSCGY